MCVEDPPWLAAAKDEPKDEPSWACASISISRQSISLTHMYLFKCMICSDWLIFCRKSLKEFVS